MFNTTRHDARSSRKENSAEFKTASLSDGHRCFSVPDIPIQSKARK